MSFSKKSHKSQSTTNKIKAFSGNFLKKHLKIIIFWLGGLLAGLIAIYINFTNPELFSTIIIAIIILLTIQKKLYYGLYIILFLPVLGELSRLNILGQNRGIIASDIIIPIFIFIWLITKKEKLIFSRDAKKIIISSIVFIFIATTALILSSTILSLSEILNSSLYLIRFIEYAFLFLITLNLLSTQAKNSSFTSEKLIKYIAFSSLLLALGGFIQLLIYPDLQALTEFGYDPHLNRLVGSWLDPNFIGGFFAFIICIFTGIALHTKKIKSKLIYLGFIAILLTALFLTYSRSAYLALAVGIFIIGLLKSRKVLIIVIIISFIGISASDRAQERVGGLLTSINSIVFNTSENPDPTARLRIESWQQTLDLINKKPLLGYGYNTLKYIKLTEGYVQDEDIHSASGSDSSFLTIAATTGILGFIPFIFIYIFALIKSLKMWLNQKTSKLIRGFSLGLFAGILSLITHSTFVNSLVFAQILIFFWISLGIIYSNQKINPASDPLK